MVDIKDSWSKSPAQFLDNELKFEQWFDASNSERETIANATIDFYHRILTPDLHHLLGDPRQKTCLEVGFGAGRLMSVALNAFKEGVGIDVTTPEVFHHVRENIVNRHGERVKLVHRDDTYLLDDESIDFVYSYIVFQHFDSFAEVERYFDVFQRVMKPGAVGRVFFVASQETHVTTQAFKVNNRAETLCVSPDDMKRLVENRGFLLVGDVIHAGRKKLWSSEGYSSQRVITFWKPNNDPSKTVVG